MNLRADAVSISLADGRALVRDLSTTLPAGSVTVVVGENGAGKSTLMDVLAGLRAPTSGRVTLGDDVVHLLGARSRATRIASVSQSAPSASFATVIERIGHGLVPRRGSGALLDARARAHVEDVADELELAPLLSRALSTLSGGERRRVEIARALVDDEAAAYILDEPDAGVDVARLPLVLRALKTRAERGAIVVVSAHALGLAFALGDRFIGLRDGEALVQDRLDDAFVSRVFGISARVVVSERHAGVLVRLEP